MKTISKFCGNTSQSPLFPQKTNFWQYGSKLMRRQVVKFSGLDRCCFIFLHFSKYFICSDRGYFEDQGITHTYHINTKTLILLLWFGAAGFTVDNITSINMWVTFLPNKALKHSRKGRSLGKFEHRAYMDKRLFVIACLTIYI